MLDVCFSIIPYDYDNNFICYLQSVSMENLIRLLSIVEISEENVQMIDFGGDGRQMMQFHIIIVVVVGWLRNS